MFRLNRKEAPLRFDTCMYVKHILIYTDIQWCIIIHCKWLTFDVVFIKCYIYNVDMFWFKLNDYLWSFSDDKLSCWIYCLQGWPCWNETPHHWDVQGTSWMCPERWTFTFRFLATQHPCPRWLVIWVWFTIVAKNNSFNQSSAIYYNTLDIQIHTSTFYCSTVH